jgi:flavin-dependent dehydrogenase
VRRDRCDVLVVGGGPAGSSCAYGLRNTGLDVVVLDRARFPRDKVCAGWVTPPVFAELAIDPAEYAKDRVLQPIRGFRVGRLGGRQALAEGGGVVSFGIRRCEFDAYLLARSGARLRLGEPLRELRREGSVWRVNDALEARVLVGAGGHFCPVARRLGAAPGAGERAVVAREVEFALDPEQAQRCPVPGELPELLFSPDLRGYGWVVRKGDHLNVGLGRLVAQGFGAELEDFLARLAALGRLPERFPGRLCGHAYLLYDAARRPLAREGALLVGDAAGLAYPRSGEGIRPAVETGLLAARAVLAAGGEPRPALEAAYVRAVESRFGRRRGRPGRGPTDFLPRAWRGPLGGVALGWPWFARRVVVDRWFLHRGEPPLAA